MTLMRYRDYPDGWLDQIRPIIMERSGGFCECEGECGLSHPHGRCLEHHGGIASWQFRARTRGRRRRYLIVRVELTVAHYPQTPGRRAPEGIALSRIKAFCQQCHVRARHEDEAAIAIKRRDERRRNGAAPRKEVALWPDAG